MEYWICNNCNFPFQLKVLLIFLKKIRPMESAVRGQVEALLLKDNSIEVCVETNGNTRILTFPTTCSLLNLTILMTLTWKKVFFRRFLSELKFEPRDLCYKHSAIVKFSSLNFFKYENKRQHLSRV